MRIRTVPKPLRRGITLTEILIAIMILGVGMIALATLFPIGLLRLRQAQRESRSAFLAESVASDVQARNLFSTDSFIQADLMNAAFGLPPWYFSVAKNSYYDPLVQDTPVYGGDPFAVNPTPPPAFITLGASAATSGGYGLPFAYDPLWRYQTGYYLDPVNLTMPEARFAAGNYIDSMGNFVSTLRPDPSDGGVASAHGLQRLTNYNRPVVQGSAAQVPAIFVSPEDVVWNEIDQGGGGPSPVLPDFRLSSVNAVNGLQPQVTSDWRFTWMVTARRNNAFNGASYDGNVVVFENRPFSMDNGQVAGETVVEAVFGPSTNVVMSTNFANVGYGSGADRSVLLRWFATQPDPVVKVGDWIADVTYERSLAAVYGRFYLNPSGTPPLLGVDNQLNFGKWDNLPAQRCFWYQVQRVTPPQADPALGVNYRSMMVYVNRSLEAKTILDANGNPVVLNAALICPYIVNVIPQTFFLR